MNYVAKDELLILHLSSAGIIDMGYHTKHTELIKRFLFYVINVYVHL